MRYRPPAGIIGDRSADYVARHIMGMSLAAFTAELPNLQQRGFPPADETTGNFDCDAIVAWRRARNPQVYRDGLTTATSARDPRGVAASVARFRSG